MSREILLQIVIYREMMSIVLVNTMCVAKEYCFFGHRKTAVTSKPVCIIDKGYVLKYLYGYKQYTFLVGSITFVIRHTLLLIMQIF